MLYLINIRNIDGDITFSAKHVTIRPLPTIVLTAGNHHPPHGGAAVGPQIVRLPHKPGNTLFCVSQPSYHFSLFAMLHYFLFLSW